MLPSDSDLVVIFRTGSQTEADIVQGLLESNGIHSVLSSRTPSVFPVATGAMGELRVAVHGSRAAEAARVLADQRLGAAGEETEDLEALEERLGYRFRDRGLLEHALTHRSRAHEDVSGGVLDNESLEFLGDSLLGFVVADLLFRRFPESDEGQKSKTRAGVVSTVSLARLAERLDLGRHLILGRGEEKTGGRRKQALLADAFEALIAAIHLDGGFAAARAFIERQFGELLEPAQGGAAGPGGTEDHKSALQEWLQSHDRALPEYRLAGETGPDHLKVFRVEVLADGAVLAEGEGRSKKEAEQRAARAALERLTGRPT